MKLETEAAAEGAVEGGTEGGSEGVVVAFEDLPFEKSLVKVLKGFEVVADGGGESRSTGSCYVAGKHEAMTKLT